MPGDFQFLALTLACAVACLRQLYLLVEQLWNCSRADVSMIVPVHFAAPNNGYLLLWTTHCNEFVEVVCL